MALTDDNMVLPVTPMNTFGGGNSGFGFGDGSWIWFLVLFILLGGWGNGYGGGYGGNELYPWMNQSDQINDGFRDQMINSNISAIQSGVNGLSNQLCNGFAGVNASINNGFAGVEAAANARQIADMQTAFGLQTAVNQGFSNIAAQQASCCCENRQSIADLKYTVATENCADRYEAANNTRDIIDAISNKTQAINDKLCQLELDNVKAQVEAKNDQISALERQLAMASLSASQEAQTARLIADNAAQTAILNPAPMPAYVVGYGSPYNYGCGNQTGCGCGSF